MPANSDPIYSKASDVQTNTALITTVAATPFDAVGTIGTDIYKVWTADATNGGFVQRLRIKYIGSTTSAATVLKVFLSNKTSGATTAADTWLIDELAIPATGAPSTTVAASSYDLPLNFPVPLSWTILVKTTVGQTAAMGFQVTAIAGKY